MERLISDFHLDGDGDWVAELSCGHDQHVRHRPPFQDRSWVVGEESRTGGIGTPIECPPCSRAELPERVRPARSGPEWTERTVPGTLLRDHRVAEGTWGLLRVHAGALRFVARSEPTLEVELGPGSTQAIPPAVPHHVTPIGSVRFSVDFLTVDRPTAGVEDGGRAPDRRGAPDDGGDPACWSGSVCTGCGSVLDGGPHRPTCTAAADG